MTRGVFFVLIALTAATAACDAKRGDPQAGQSAAPSPAPSAAATTPAPSAAPSTDGRSARPAAGGCPGRYVAPDPHRPVITIRFDVATDRRSVTGSEDVVFTPDRPVNEMVFRLWPNSASAPRGTALTVTSAAVGAASRFTTASLGGRPGSQGTLLSIPLERRVPAGQPLTATLRFRLALPGPAFDRWGSTGTTAWWATGHPLLAWERGVGWLRDPATRVPGEAATSEAARTDLTVTAPASDTVLMSGRTDAPASAGAGRRRWHATSASARDVSVTVGPFVTRSETVSGVRVAVGMARNVGDPAQLLAEARRSVQALRQRYGPFPFDTLVYTALPAVGGGGIEYPGAIMVGPRNWHVAVPHETAHQYFYGMLGDDQARDPWLDEAFATYSEALVNHDEAQYLPGLGFPGQVGVPMRAWGSDDELRYYQTVYVKGAAALLTARQQAGPAVFDRALRCYVAANAWRITGPADLANALARLPRAQAVLRRAGALP